MAFTSQEYAALWARRVGAVTPQVRATVRQFGRTLLATSEGYLHRDIYAIPEDVSPTGRPLWRRTGQLAARERIEYSGDGAGVRLLNDTPYAEPRHEAGKPGRRPTRRPAPWRDQALLAIQLVKPEMIAAMLDNIHAGNANGPIPQPVAPSGLPAGVTAGSLAARGGSGSPAGGGSGTAAGTHGAAGSGHTAARGTHGTTGGTHGTAGGSHGTAGGSHGTAGGAHGTAGGGFSLPSRKRSATASEAGGGGGGGGGSARRRLPRQPRRAKPNFNTRTHRRGH